MQLPETPIDASASTSVDLPGPLDSEMQALLHGFLASIFEAAQSWQDLSTQLHTRGYALAFRQGRLVVVGERGKALCTGGSIGVPMRTLSRRLGRPCIRANRNGLVGRLA